MRYCGLCLKMIEVDACFEVVDNPSSLFLEYELFKAKLAKIIDCAFRLVVFQSGGICCSFLKIEP